MSSLGMLKFIKIIVKLIKPLVKILLKLGLLNSDVASSLFAGLLGD